MGGNRAGGREAVAELWSEICKTNSYDGNCV
jgi:hypothetical protein